MFYEVRIFNTRGKLKKTLSSAELSQRYWKKIAEQETGLNPAQTRTKKLSIARKRILDAQIPTFSQATG